MHLNAHEDKFGWRAWKTFPWEATDGLHERGLIDEPRSKAKSVALTDEGARLAEQLFAEWFGSTMPNLDKAGCSPDMAVRVCGQPLSPGGCLTVSSR